MFKRLFASALFAGLAAGIFATLLQLWLVVPLIQEAELYETGVAVHFGGTEGLADATHDHSAHDHTALAQEDVGAESLAKRHSLTFFMNFVVYAGFAFVMAALVMGLGKNDEGMSLHQGVIWGMAGFIATHLAPSMGLPPELPGTPAADIVARQMWWIGTMFATITGLSLFAFSKSALMIVTGLVFIAAPHVIGAPHLEGYFGAGPPELAALFAARSIGVGAFVWIILGLAFASTWSRIKAE